MLKIGQVSNTTIFYRIVTIKEILDNRPASL